jgi:hypothetical protein
VQGSVRSLKLLMRDGSGDLKIVLFVIECGTMAPHMYLVWSVMMNPRAMCVHAECKDDPCADFEFPESYQGGKDFNLLCEACEHKYRSHKVATPQGTVSPHGQTFRPTLTLLDTTFDTH